MEREGLFYVIDGFLDVSLPSEKAESDDNVPRAGERSTSTASRPSESQSKTRPMLKSTFSASSTSTRAPKRSEQSKSRGNQPNVTEGRHLFTVKPGGIAGYLGAFKGVYWLFY